MNRKSSPTAEHNTDSYRPLTIVVLILLTALYSANQWFEFGLLMTNRELLLELPLTISPDLLAGLALVNGIISIVLIIGLWRRNKWAKIGIQVFYLLIVLQLWIELLLSPDPIRFQTQRGSTFFISLLILVSVIFLIQHPQSRIFFQSKSTE